MIVPNWSLKCLILALVHCLAVVAAGEERFQGFDKDPRWDGHNNRSTAFQPRTIRQDFGYSPTAHAGGRPGEIGGLVTAAAEPAYYAKRIPTVSLNDALSAAGRVVCQGGGFHVLIGFFNSGTTKEWRTANSLVIRLLGRGKVFYAFVEYATSRWRAGGDSPGGFATVPDPATGRLNPRGFAMDIVHDWSLRYDPKGNKGNGSIVLTLAGETAVCNLDSGHKADGATFDRFGLLPVLKSADDAAYIWLDDVAINGTVDHFDRDPKWEAVGNRRTYVTSNIRPRFDFGFSPTHYAGGLKAGELGGLVFRGDCRYAERLASYGDRLALLTLEKPLKASGKVCLRRAVSDSTVLLGFYHSRESMVVHQSQASGIPRNFLGIAIEGPSSEGFYLYPMYRVGADGQGYADGPNRPHILPDGRAHNWSLEYSPASSSGQARLEAILDGRSSRVLLGRTNGAAGTTFDRFGLVTTWIDGNGQHIYFDDLMYTYKQ